nr:hypothetical protein [Paenibacillus sp. IHB B 3084]
MFNDRPTLDPFLERIAKAKLDLSADPPINPDGPLVSQIHLGFLNYSVIREIV